MAKGVFTPVLLGEVQVKLEQMWKEPQYSKFYEIEGETVRAVLDNQTASFPELKDPSKKKEVAVKWVDFCDNTAKTVTEKDTCDNTGCDEPDPKTETYKLNTFLESCFTISDDDYQTTIIDRDATIAKGWMAQIRNLIELFNTKTIAVIDANAGINPYAGDFEIDGNTTNISKADFTIEKVYPYFILVMKMLRSKRAFLLDGQNLFTAKILADAYKLNTDGKVDASLFSKFPYYNDLMGFIEAGVANKTYAIDYGALAIVTRGKYGTIHEAGNDTTRWTLNLGSYGYPELDVDVQYQLTCVDGDLVHSWKFKLRSLIAVNPVTCDAGNTGIQSFTKVDAYTPPVGG